MILKVVANIFDSLGSVCINKNFLHDFDWKYENSEESKKAKNAPNSGARFLGHFLLGKTSTMTNGWL